MALVTNTRSGYDERHEHTSVTLITNLEYRNVTSVIGEWAENFVCCACKFVNRPGRRDRVTTSRARGPVRGLVALARRTAPAAALPGKASVQNERCPVLNSHG